MRLLDCSHYHPRLSPRLRHRKQQFSAPAAATAHEGFVVIFIPVLTLIGHGRRRARRRRGAAAS